jgi:NitT/TauT family transport system substrate-binding protein
VTFEVPLARLAVWVTPIAQEANKEEARMKKVVSEISGTVFSLPWLIAKDHGLFEAEGIDMEFVRARPSGAVTHTEDPSEVNPILGHVAFEEARVSIYRA